MARHGRRSTILYEALFLEFRDQVVTRLKNVLSEDEIARAFKEDVREQQIASLQDGGKQRADAYSTVDVIAVGQLVWSYRKRLIPMTGQRSNDERVVATLDSDLRAIRKVRDALAHPTGSNQPTESEAVAAVAAAKSVLQALGLEPLALDPYLAELRAGTRPSLASDGAGTGGTLPPALRLLGREVETLRIRDMIEAADGNLVTVTGPAGVGKTALVGQVAHDLAGRGRNVLFVGLEAASSWKGALALLARALDVRSRSLNLPLIASALSARPGVVILDNFEHLLEGAPDVQKLAQQCPASRFIVTSRERLSVPAEQVFRVSPLPVPLLDDSLGDVRSNPAVELFVDRVRAGRGDFKPTPDELTTIADIMRRVDGVALAIVLAAAHTIDRDVATVQAELSRLINTPTGLRQRSSRLQTMSACLKWSWDLVSSDERTLLKRCCLLFGRFHPMTLAAACHGSELSSERVDSAAVILVRRNLLQRDEGRFSLLEVVRQFVADQLEGSDRTGVLKGLVGRATDLAESAMSATHESDDQEDVRVEAWWVGSNVLALLEPGNDLTAGEVLPFLVGWCRLSWDVQAPFDRWDEELIEGLQAWTHRRRAHSSTLTARALIELAGLLNAYDRLTEASDAVVLAVAEAVDTNDVDISEAAAGAFVRIAGDNVLSKKLTIRRLRRRPLTKATSIALCRIAFPEYPAGEYEHSDRSLAIESLQWVAKHWIAEDSIADAREPMSDAGMLLLMFGGTTAQWRRQVELGIHSGEVGQAAYTYEDWAISVLGLGEVAESLDSVLGHPDFLNSCDRRTLLRAEQLLHAGVSLSRSFRGTTLSAAVSLAIGAHEKAVDSLEHITDRACSSHEEAAIATALVVRALEPNHGGHSDYLLSLAKEILVWVALWLRRSGNPMAGYGIAAGTGRPAAVPGNRSLHASEKRKVHDEVDGMTLTELCRYAQREVGRMANREREAALRDLGFMEAQDSSAPEQPTS